MEPLEPPDSHHFSAALGWLELGNLAEAREDWDRLSPAARQRPEVMELRWIICAEGAAWDEGLAIAEALVKSNPDNPSGWLHRAYALRRASGGGLAAAWEALRPAFEKFPTEPTIPYNLACYACQLQRLTEAREWLRQALGAGDQQKLKRMALRDADLEPLWEEIRRL